MVTFIFLISCGQNAFVRLVDNSQARRFDPIDGARLIPIIIDDINLGVVEVGREFLLPLYIFNPNEFKVHDLSFADLGGSEVFRTLSPDNERSYSFGRSSTDFLLAFSPNKVGAFNYQIDVKYQILGEAFVVPLKVMGIASSSIDERNANLEPYRKDFYEINHGNIPVQSESIVETVIKNIGVNTALVRKIEIQDPQYFKLLNETDCLKGVVENCVLKTSFRPLQEGEVKTLVIITYSSGDGEIYKLEIPIRANASRLNKCIQQTEHARFAVREVDINDVNEVNLPLYERVRGSSYQFNLWAWF